MKETIYRQDAIKWCRPEEWGTPDERWRPESEYGRYIQSLPSAERKGKWIKVKWESEYFLEECYLYRCDNCNKERATMENYCPNCGASMVRGEEDASKDR